MRYAGRGGRGRVASNATHGRRFLAGLKVGRSQSFKFSKAISMLNRGRGNRRRSRRMSARQLRAIEIAAIVLLAAAPFYVGAFRITLLNYVGVYALAALGLVLLTGIGGMVSMGQAAFVGIAAYATAWATTIGGYSPWIGLVLALVLTALAAAAIGVTTLRLGGHFLALSTVAWGLSIYYLFGNLTELGRFTGISGIPPVSIGAFSLMSSTRMFYLIWGVAIA